MVAYLFIAGLFVAAIAVSILAAKFDFGKKNPANSWPSTLAHLKDWRIQLVQGAESNTYMLHMQLALVVDGRTFVGKAKEEFDTERAAREFIDGLGDGPLLIYYDPKDPLRIAMNREPLVIAPLT